MKKIVLVLTLIFITTPCLAEITYERISNTKVKKIITTEEVIDVSKLKIDLEALKEELLKLQAEPDEILMPNDSKFIMIDELDRNIDSKEKLIEELDKVK